MITPNRNKWYREPYTYRLDLELGNAEDGETPAVEAGREIESFAVASLVSRRMVSATFSPTLVGGLLLPPCNRIEYSSSWRKNPIFGLTNPRFCLTAASASSGVILIVAMRYAHTIVALRLMPIKQWT